MRIINNSFTSFIILCFFSLCFTYLSSELLRTNEIIYNSLAEQLTQDQIEETLKFKEKWDWLNNVFIPILLFIKIGLIAAIIDLGAFLFNKKIKYKIIFNFVTKAEFVFLLVIVFKTAWLYFFQTDYKLEDLQYFYPISLINITGYEGIDPWFIYPFQVLNLFEMAYWIILSYLIGKELNAGIDKGFTIVASSYGIGLLIWVVAVMFLMLNIS